MIFATKLTDKAESFSLGIIVGTETNSHLTDPFSLWNIYTCFGVPKGPFPLRAWKKAFFVCFIAFFLRSLQF